MSDPVLALLEKEGLRYTISGKDYLIKCLNPEHEDTNPSCRVDRATGLTHCFSCGFKCNLFKYFGVFTNNISMRTESLRNKLKELASASVTVSMPEDAVPFNENFRGIKYQTFRHFDAFYCYSISKLEDRIVFPITDITGKIVVFQARHRLSDAKPKYVFYPSNRAPPCFPAIIESGTKTLVLVEGMFDMLNLYDKGLTNVACVFGTQSLLNNTVSKLLPYKAQGINKIILAFDGDDPGQKATEEILPLIKDCGFMVDKITLESDMDPGILTQEQVDIIKEYISEDSDHR